MCARSSATPIAPPDCFPPAPTSVGDLVDAPSVAAVRGVDGVCHLQATPGIHQTQVVIGAARSADVAKIVARTSMGAVLKPAPTISGDFVAHADLLRRCGLDVTFIRPGNLMSKCVRVGRWYPQGRSGRRLLR